MLLLPKLGLLLTAVLISSVAAAEAASPGAVRSKSGLVGAADVCVDVANIDEAVLRPMVEAIVTPGRKLDLASIPPDTLAQYGAFQRVEAERAKVDWANLCRYRNANIALTARRRQPAAVFMGDSITENWQRADPAFLDASFVDRGISGQTSAQMLLRFYPDVVRLRPRVVHIMAGTNDVAGNQGPVTDEAFLDDIRAMIDLAQVNNIRVVLASIPPAAAFGWRPEIKPAARIIALNAALRRMATERRVIYVDYYGKLTDAQGGLPLALANDGVHPNRDGYAIMRPLAERAIADALR